MTSTTYTPVLTGKYGELQALEQLSAANRIGLTPLIDMPPVPRPRPPAKGKPPDAPTPPAEVLERLLVRLAKAWGRKQRILIDLDGFEAYQPGEMHPVRWVAEGAKRHGLRAALVVSTQATAEYLAEAEAHRDSFTDTVLRVHADLDDDPSVLADRAFSLAEALKTVPTVTDLVVDLGRLRAEANASAAVELIQAFGLPPRWRSMVLATTALPDFSKLPPTDGRRFARADWKLWEEAIQEVGPQLGYSDYSITGPRRQTDDPAYAGAPHLRYSTATTTWVWKGERQGDFDPGVPYPELCSKMMRLRAGQRGRPIFRGRTFSWGDSRMAATAAGYAGPGSGSTWVAHATNHHITQALEQLHAR